MKITINPGLLRNLRLILRKKENRPNKRIISCLIHVLPNKRIKEAPNKLTLQQKTRTKRDQ